MMTDTTQLTYFFDPLCGWCYGASATLEKLVARPDFTFKLAPTGLFAGEGAKPMDDGFAAYAWANDQRISRLTGQPFSEEYRVKVLGDRTRLFDSGPAILALTAVALSAPSREFQTLTAIQKARYVDGRDSTDMAALAEILRGLGLREAAERFASPDDALFAVYRERTEAARAELRRFGASGVPTLIAGEGKDRYPINSSALFGRVDALVTNLRAA